MAKYISIGKVATIFGVCCQTIRNWEKEGHFEKVKRTKGNHRRFLSSVNPAYSSIIAKFKFALMYGITVHVAASLVLARRAFRFSEKLSGHIFSIFQQKLPTKNALRLAEHRRRHVWVQC